MGIQGNKAATHEHDFLSLYTATAAAKDSPLPLHDSKAPPPSQGLFLKTHDFLQPLEKPPGAPEPSPPLGAGTGHHQQVVIKQHGLPLPGGVGAFSISPAPGAGPGPRSAAVKAEPPFVLWGQPAAAPAAQPGARGHHHQWTFPFAGAGRVRPRQQHPPPDNKGRGGGGGLMESGSRSSCGAGFDDDDGLTARREVSSLLKELTVRVDRQGGSCSDGGTDQRPNTPRSKHSATEQRRRSKINDRFQILRDLLPHSDQKRDKATFLLEVIEYIRFLQEKEQKYEASFPEWNQENAKILPWSNVYFRSFWKNAQSKGQIPGDALPDPSLFMRNGSSPGFNFTGKPDGNHNTVSSAAASGAQDQVETDHMASVSYRSAETPTNITNNITSQSQPQWTSPSPVDDCAMNSEMLNNQQLTIDEGTISVSSQYSQELLNSLTHALQSSGIDLSQASISVQINLGKRAVKRPAAGEFSNSKEPTEPSSNNDHQLTMLGGGAEYLSHATKRHKSGNS
ncbi:transcription factor BIM2-like isoform X5 [Phragmites australis]|uniref:transcription factor BIM2-like isoform X5 n=1 Tax=Phragmites australis TaxID=29695 RepID=UPI002D77D507|nr:transcription factor BIM2-like isoform X5 [Phragmites australis]